MQLMHRGAFMQCFFLLQTLSKTGHAMFRQCFEENIYLDVFDHV